MTRLLALASTLLLSTSALAAPRAIAIGYFDNTTNDPLYEPLRKGLADMLITDLALIRSIQIVEREKLNHVINELKLQQSRFFDPETAQKLGKGVGAEYLMVGSYFVARDLMRIDARIIQVATGHITAATKVEGNKDEFFGLEKELVELLTGALELKLEVSEKTKLRKSQTESYQAFAAYSDGLDAADRGDRATALESFQKALEADPQYKAARSALERLQEAIRAHEQVRGKGFEARLEQLNPASPTFYRDVERLPESFGGTYLEQEQRKYILLAYLCEQGYRPWREAYAGHDFLAHPKSYYELEEGISLASTWGAEPDVLDAAVSVVEYLLKKYPDDTNSRRQLRQTVARLEQSFAYRQGGKERPSHRSGESALRAQWVRELFAVIEKRHTATLKPAQRDPKAILERLRKALDEESKRSHETFDAEFKKQLAALDPKAERVGFALSDLLAAAHDHFERYDERTAAFRYQLLAHAWIVQHDARPYSGTPDRPHHTEMFDLLQLMMQYEKDPKTNGLLPPVGEYLLKKYADDPFINSQMKMRLEGIKYCREHRDECAEDWEREKSSPQYIHAEQARSLFRSIAARK